MYLPSYTRIREVRLILFALSIFIELYAYIQSCIEQGINEIELNCQNLTDYLHNASDVQNAILIGIQLSSI